MLFGNDSIDIACHLTDFCSQTAQRTEHFGSSLSAAMRIPTAEQVQTGTGTDGKKPTKATEPACRK